MVNASYKKYESYQDFIVDVLFNVMDDDMVSLIINYEDYQGVLATLFEKTINGNSFYLSKECADLIDDDIATAQMNDGNMLVTIFNTGEIVGEPIVFKTEEAFAEGTYFIEYDAKNAVGYPIKGTVIPFQIKKDKI